MGRRGAIRGRRQCDWYVCCGQSTRSEVVVAGLRWPCLFVILHMRGMWRTGPRGCSGRFPQGHIDDESVIYCLSTWVISI